MFAENDLFGADTGIGDNGMYLLSNCAYNVYWVFIETEQVDGRTRYETKQACYIF